ncbi:hypothetical protein D9M68_478000 [compost metagenome]
MHVLMKWFKSRPVYLLSGLVLFGACSSEEPKPAIIRGSYFSLKTYIEKEAGQLNKQSVRVLKTVYINGDSEQKEVKIADFKKELGSFIDADINKSSWKDEFTVQSTDHQTIYKTVKPNIPVKRIEISYELKKIKSIKILLSTTNLLYHAADTLYYESGKGYEIRKKQKINLFNEKRYKVMGKFIFP